MSRSRRRTPIAGNTTAPTDKPFKQIEHRKARAAERAALARGEDPPSVRAFGNPYSSQKDGKHWRSSPWPKLMRK